MGSILKRQPMWLNLKAVTNDCFAYGIVTDHRADWALVNDYQQLQENIKFIRRNHG